jgi:hypothetical protein
MSGLDPPPTPTAKLEIIVTFVQDVEELSPGHEDTIQASVSKKAREAGITPEPIFVHQDVSIAFGEPMEPNALNELTFQLQETTISADQLPRLTRIIVDTCRDFEVPASQENVLVSTYAPLNIS